MNSHSFFAMVPSTVLSDKNLSNLSKLLLGEIIALADENGTCYPSNGYLAELFGVTETSISLCISQLVKNKWVATVIDKENNNQRYIQLLLTPMQENLKGALRKLKGGYLRNLKGTVYENSSIEKLDSKLSNDVNVTGLKGVGEKIESGEYGNLRINYLLKGFDKYWEFEPTDRQPRREAWNLARNIQRLCKEMGVVCDEERFNKVSDAYLRWVSKQDWASNIQKMETLRLKFRMFEAHARKEKNVQKG